MVASQNYTNKITIANRKKQIGQQNNMALVQVSFAVAVAVLSSGADVPSSAMLSSQVEATAGTVRDIAALASKEPHTSSAPNDHRPSFQVQPVTTPADPLTVQSVRFVLQRGAHDRNATTAYLIETVNATDATWTLSYWICANAGAGAGASSECVTQTTTSCCVAPEIAPSDVVRKSW
jgi:hypothetical protein